jgi:hypothetical protein
MGLNVNSVILRTRIVEYLYDAHQEARNGIGAVEVAVIARDLDASAKVIAVICNDLMLHKHAEGDGNMMGFYRLSDAGVAYYEEVTAMQRR